MGGFFIGEIMPTWPVSTLPKPLAGSYQETPPVLALRTEMDAGPAKVRRRFTAGVRPVSFRLIMTKAQVAILEAFYLEDCSGGAIAFDWPHPRTAAESSWRFVEPPTFAHLNGLYYSVSVSLEQMP